MANKSGIRIKPSRKGLLHKKLGVPAGKPIPESKLEAAKNSKSASERKEANFAVNAKGFNHSRSSMPTDANARKVLAKHNARKGK